DVIPGVNDTAKKLLHAIKPSHSEVYPSSLFAVADILEGEPFVNEFLVNAGIKPPSIALYKHIWQQRRTQPLRRARRSPSPPWSMPTTSSAVGEKTKGEYLDHIVVIKYVPTVGDSQHAIDEYYSEVFCGGRSTINIFNECEDSLLATPLILDLTILTELLTRIKYRVAYGSAAAGDLKPYMLKAPPVKPGTDIVNRSSTRSELPQGLHRSRGQQ
ncbi:hypothetical protein C0992_010914, partial [Termitomyces sp. T32_za158]